MSDLSDDGKAFIRDSGAKLRARIVELERDRDEWAALALTLRSILKCPEGTDLVEWARLMMVNK